MLDRVKALPSRWRWLRVTIDVQNRFNELQGGYVAGAVTLALFLSMFPLILVCIAIVGFFSSGASNDLAGEIISSLGLTGTAAEQMREAIRTAEQSRRMASVIGLGGLLWAGLGVIAAFQYAVDTAWQATGRGIKEKLFAILWLVGAGLLMLASVALTALLNFLSAYLAPAAFVGSLAAYVALFWWTFKVLGSRDVGWRPLLPGAVLAAVGFQLMTAVGAVYVPRAVASSSGLYGSIGVVFAVLAWLFILGRLLVYASVLNVVQYERRRGTVTVELEVPHIPGEVPLGANRSGAVVERV